MRKKTCCICGAKILKGSMIFVKKSNGYICSKCKALKQYSFREFETIEPKDASDKLARSIGFELETIRPSDYATLELIKRGFNATHDGTVDIEFKSPIYKSKKRLVEDLHFIDKLLKDKEILITDKCGTHVRIGNIKYFEIVNSNVKESIATIVTDPFFLWLFGRSTNKYACIDTNVRECIINTSNVSKYDAIEYRLPRFRNKKRFASLLDLLLKLTDALCDNASDVFCVLDNFKYDFLRKYENEFKKTNFDYYANKIANTDLTTSDFDAWDYVSDFIDDEFYVYDSLDELQDNTCCTIDDLLDWFDRGSGLDNINNNHFVCHDSELIYVYYNYEDFKQWVVDNYEDAIESYAEYEELDIFENTDREVESLYEDIKDGLTYEDYLQEYCEIEVK